MRHRDRPIGYAGRTVASISALGELFAYRVKLPCGLTGWVSQKRKDELLAQARVPHDAFWVEMAAEAVIMPDDLAEIPRDVTCLQCIAASAEQEHRR